MSLSFLPYKKNYTFPKNCQVENLPAIYKQIFGYRTTGYFVEVGAMNGEDHSNTCGLADIGWNGLYIEATQKYAQECYERHKKNKVQVIRRAISDHEGTLRFRLANTLTSADPLSIEAYSTMEWSRAYLHNTYEDVPCYTLDQTLEEFNAPREFDLLAIDVEGHEQQVLDGFSFEKWRPKMIIIEIQDEHPDFQSLPNAHEFIVRYKQIRKTIESAGYTLLYKNIINSVYVRV